MTNRGINPPVISVWNASTTLGSFNLDELIVALQSYLDNYYMPVWGRSATLVKSTAQGKGNWGCVFLDNADAPGALAYHDEENHMPVSKVFVKTITDNGESLSVAASHELVEMLTDDVCNRYVTGADGQTLYAFEVGDAVEETHFPVFGIEMTNFVYPSWFSPDPIGGLNQKYDYMGLCKMPFELLNGGYAITINGGQFNQIFGSKEKEARFAKEDRRGHRGEYRRGKIAPQKTTP